MSLVVFVRPYSPKGYSDPKKDLKTSLKKYYKKFFKKKHMNRQFGYLTNTNGYFNLD